MKPTVLLCLTFCALVWRVVQTSSGYSCNQEWEVDRTDNRAMFETFQNWLHAWQNDCSKQFYEGMPMRTGIGSSIVTSSNWFEFALEHGQIYRPTFEWIWANADPSNCTILGKPWLDCYFKPLSCCSVDKSAGMRLSEWDGIQNQPGSPSYETEKSTFLKYLEFAPTALDSCELAKRAKKSLQWVHSNIIYYISRPSVLLQAEIEDRAKEFLSYLDGSELRSKNGLTIGVHIRGTELLLN
jgi:hypothetical protein